MKINPPIILIFVIFFLVSFTIGYKIAGYDNEHKLKIINDKIDQSYQQNYNNYSYYLDKYYQQSYEESLWECVEYGNKSTINELWIENCCIQVNLTDEEKTAKGYMPEGEFTIIATQLPVNTEIQTPFVCFESNSRYGKITLENKTINFNDCQDIRENNMTTELWCVTKKRRET